MILVTGGTGFIGRRLVRRLLLTSSPNDIVCLVKPPATPHESEGLRLLQDAGVRLIEGDLDDPAVSRTPPPECRLIFHLGANIDTRASEAASRVNDQGCANLLAWLGPRVSGARIVYTSSVAVIDRDAPADGPLDENSPCVPRTAYGRTKLGGERIITGRAAELGYSYTILRLATVYGPGAKVDGLFALLYKLAKKRSLLARVNWPGRTSIIHVDDVAAMLAGLAVRREAANEIYCVSNDYSPTVGELAEMVGQLAPGHGNPVRLPHWFWQAARAAAWSAPAKLLGGALSPTNYWRLTLIVDDGFWFDTSKLQQVWHEPPRDVLTSVKEMVDYF